jgi:hypothetical protein
LASEGTRDWPPAVYAKGPRRIAQRFFLPGLLDDCSRVSASL